MGSLFFGNCLGFLKLIVKSNILSRTTVCWTSVRARCAVQTCIAIGSIVVPFGDYLIGPKKELLWSLWVESRTIAQGIPLISSRVLGCDWFWAEFRSKRLETSRKLKFQSPIFRNPRPEPSRAELLSPVNPKNRSEALNKRFDSPTSKQIGRDIKPLNPIIARNPNLPTLPKGDDAPSLRLRCPLRAGPPDDNAASAKCSSARDFGRNHRDP